MDKIIEKLDKGNPVHKLTVAIDRITIKFKVDSDDFERAEVCKFFMYVASQLQGEPLTWRGTLYQRHNDWTITMYDNKKETPKTFHKLFNVYT